MPRIAVDKIGGINVAAFLDMLAWSEIGADILAASDAGYNVLVGSLPGQVHLFDSYADHPRQLVKLNRILSSTAAGRYQIKANIFDAYKVQLGLPDFSPESQDRIAVQLIRECHALPLLAAGKLVEAVMASASRWASLPGYTYGQHVQKIDDLAAAYLKAGGSEAV